MASLLILFQMIFGGRTLDALIVESVFFLENQTWLSWLTEVSNIQIICLQKESAN